MIPGYKNVLMTGASLLYTTVTYSIARNYLVIANHVLTLLYHLHQCILYTDVGGIKVLIHGLSICTPLNTGDKPLAI